MTKNPHLEKKTLHLRTGDWEYLDGLVAPSTLTTSLLIRKLVSNYVDAQQAKETPITVDVEPEL